MHTLKKLCAFGSATFIATGAQATLHVYEPFNYTAGANLIGQNGGTGFSGAYVHTDPFNPNSDHTISANTLTYTNLQTSGRAVTAPAAGSPDFLSTTARPFTLPGGVNFGTNNGTLYASFLIRPGTAASGGYGGLALVNNDSLSSNKPIFFGDSSGTWRLEEQGGANSQNTGIVSTANATALLVLKYTFNTGNDNLRLYVNPTVGAVEPFTASASLTIPTDFLRMELLDGIRAYQYDEVRIGTTYADVTPAITPLTNTISLSTAGAATGTQRALGGFVDVNGSGNSYISEVDELNAHTASGHVVVDNNLGGNAPVYVMLWTENDGVLSSINAVGGTSVTPGTDQWNNLQAAYGVGGIEGEAFNYLIKFNSNSFGAGNGAVNWDFQFNPTTKIDKIAIVPEPGTMSMLAIAGVGLLGRRRRR